MKNLHFMQRHFVQQGVITMSTHAPLHNGHVIDFRDPVRNSEGSSVPIETKLIRFCCGLCTRRECSRRLVVLSLTCGMAFSPSMKKL